MLGRYHYQAAELYWIDSDEIKEKFGLTDSYAELMFSSDNMDEVAKKFAKILDKDLRAKKQSDEIEQVAMNGLEYAIAELLDAIQSDVLLFAPFGNKLGADLIGYILDEIIEDVPAGYILFEVFDLSEGAADQYLFHRQRNADKMDPKISHVRSNMIMIEENLTEEVSFDYVDEAGQAIARALMRDHIEVKIRRDEVGPFAVEYSMRYAGYSL